MKMGKSQNREYKIIMEIKNDIANIFEYDYNIIDKLYKRKRKPI